MGESLTLSLLTLSSLQCNCSQQCVAQHVVIITSSLNICDIGDNE